METKQELAKYVHALWTETVNNILNSCVKNGRGRLELLDEELEKLLRIIYVTKDKFLPKERQKANEEIAEEILRFIQFDRKLKEQYESGKEFGITYILDLLLDQKKITHEEYTKLLLLE